MEEEKKAEEASSVISPNYEFGHLDLVTIIRGADGEWRWKRKSPNGRIVGASTEGYKNFSACRDNLLRSFIRAGEEFNVEVGKKKMISKIEQQSEQKLKPVLVTTEYKGVFFVYVANDDAAPAKIELCNVRNCIYWAASVNGVLGLAKTGPNKECKIGPSVPSATLWKLTAIFDCTPEAAAAWEAI